MGYIRREQRVSKPLEEVFSFFSAAENLQRLTPPLLDFHILTPPPIPMHTGALIDYRIKVRGFPMRWRTRIENWNPPASFIDTQLKGPYRKWHHLHEFKALSPTETLIIDTVHYELPFGPLGALVAKLFVDRDVRAIFDFRFQEIERIFSSSQTTS
jgi:ligand-binding SRPBCC domain-containing protein